MNTTKPNQLTAAVQRVLRPLIRILLRNGVPHRAFAEMAKQVYVDLALSEFHPPGRKAATISRAAVITGLTRKEIQRLQQATADAPEDGVERYHRAARVVSGWVRDARYSSDTQGPLPLPFEGEGATFTELVRRYSGDMPPRAVLDELLRVGAVERLKDGGIRLLARAYIPRAGEAEKLDILGNDVADLIGTIDHNLVCAPPHAWVQRKVTYDNLPDEFVAELRPEVAVRAQALLEELDRLMAAHDRDVNPDAAGSGRHRAAVGIYYYEEKLDFPEESK